jgi:hypothetical protein
MARCERFRHTASGKDAYYVDEFDAIAALWTVLSLFG